MSSKKIALMTWHHVRNYGTALQAYALKTILEKNGFLVDLIDYRREYSKPLKYKSLDKLFIGRLKFRGKKKKRVDFDNKLFEEFFNNYFSYTFSCRYSQDLNKLNELYDAFVCGSDQIWGPEWFNPVYFLDFVNNRNKLIAYAPSIGVEKISDTGIFDNMEKLIDRFPSVSVREESGCRIIENMGIASVYNVLDPVLLLTKKEWKEISKPIQKLPSKYAVVFFLKNNKRSIKKCINHLRNQNVTPFVFHSTQSEDNKYANFDGCSVEQILYLIEHAQAVYTDSFHITVLSLIFERQFTLFLKNKVNENNSKNSRLFDLLGKLDLIANIYDCSKCLDKKIDYSIIRKRIDDLRLSSYTYLENELTRALNSNKTIDENNSNTICPYECEKCIGQTDKFFSEIKNPESFIAKRMVLWGFNLEEKCYGCKYLNREKLFNSYRPLFYESLKKNFSEKKSLLYIYLKYYAAYDLPKILNKKKNGK